MDGRRLEQLKKAASVSDVKATAADLIGKRAMSRHDLERKLQEKGASQAEARYAAEDVYKRQERRSPRPGRFGRIPSC